MWYLCVFFHRLLEYRKAEFESLAGLFDGCSGATTLEWRLPEDHHPDSPFHYVNLPSEEMARNIANRSKYLCLNKLTFLYEYTCKSFLNSNMCLLLLVIGFYLDFSLFWIELCRYSCEGNIWNLGWRSDFWGTGGGYSKLSRWTEVTILSTW